MKITKPGALGVALVAGGLFSTPSLAQDISYGCTFDRFTGVTKCPVVAGNPPRPTGEYVTSRPNIGIDGTFVHRDGNTTVRVYVQSNALTGRQPFYWQK